MARQTTSCRESPEEIEATISKVVTGSGFPATAVSIQSRFSNASERRRRRSAPLIEALEFGSHLGKMREIKRWLIPYPLTWLIRPG
jgi:hypothetical protein